MPTYQFARNTLREYYDVTAPDEATARAMLADDETRYYSGSRSTDDDEEPFELIDIEWERANAD